MPDPEIHVYRKGLWRPWRWEYRDLEGARKKLVNLRDGSAFVDAIEGRAWTYDKALAHARHCQLLRREGRRRAAS